MFKQQYVTFRVDSLYLITKSTLAGSHGGIPAQEKIEQKNWCKKRCKNWCKKKQNFWV